MLALFQFFKNAFADFLLGIFAEGDGTMPAEFVDARYDGAHFFEVHWLNAQLFAQELRHPSFKLVEIAEVLLPDADEDFHGLFHAQNFADGFYKLTLFLLAAKDVKFFKLVEDEENGLKMGQVELFELQSHR